MEPDEIINPRKTLQRRMAAAGLDGPVAASAPASAPSGPRFGKQFSTAERMEQQRKLAEMLRKR